MKQILLVAIAAGLLFFGAGLYLAHGEEAPAPYANGSAFPKEYVVPRISRTDTPQRIRESKSCREYLNICERSCRDRGEMFKFSCIGQDFQPFQDHFRCQCADDLYFQQRFQKDDHTQPIQVKDKSAENKQ